MIRASDLFRALAADLVGSDVLLNEINTRIAKLDDGTPEGTLRADLCGLVFLIGKLPRQGAVDLGVRANAAHARRPACERNHKRLRSLPALRGRSSWKSSPTTAC